MKTMQVISKYFISIFVLALPFVTQAQVSLERQKFVRFGLDLSRFTLPYIKDYGQSGFEASLDSEIKYRYFPTLEVGYSKIDDKTELHNYYSDGNYFRFGFDYNVIKYKHRLDRNLFFVGARYGYTGYSHQADMISITNGWGTLETSLPLTQLNAQWVEGVIGMRGEIVKNLYLGYTIRVKFMLKHSNYGDYTPYWVPGFGESEKLVAVGLSYSVFYAIPIKNPKLDFEK